MKEHDGCIPPYHYTDKHLWNPEDKGRVHGCPLIEIPTPHGRLIDADALKKEIDKIWFADSGNCSDVYAEINDAHTIIPAEEKKEKNNESL